MTRFGTQRDIKINIKLFPSNKKIKNNLGIEYTVDNVRIKGDKLFVKFRELEDVVDSQYIVCESTMLTHTISYR